MFIGPFDLTMRAGGCTLQQSLTPESATLVKQSIAVARRRGHAQVTPLHVASTLLSTSNGLLRAACLHSHSHPLQCKALELCFNVALNRLPSSTTTSLLGHAHQYLPALSNALVAAFKRAQAHQRRGSIETQQQPLLAVKIEVEQLVISILDDPSVSRVMREAGFSSTQVKSNVEQAVEISSSSPDDAGGDRKPIAECMFSRRKERSVAVVGDRNTVMRCRVGNPASLQTHWALNPLTIPAGGLGLSLGLSLSLSHDTDDSYLCDHDEQQHGMRAAPKILPPWLQQYKENQECSSWMKTKKTKNSDGCSSTPVVSSSFSSEECHYYEHRFKELNAENLKNLCSCLEKKVPWQMDIIPEISTTILQCRSGMARRWKNNIRRSKEDTWMLFQGNDVEGKRKISKELASVVFGSDSSFVSIGRARYDTDNEDYEDDLGLWNYKKRPRSEPSLTYIDRFAEAVGENPHRVFLLEDVDQVDCDGKMRIKHAIESGSVSWVRGSCFLEDGIIILCCKTVDNIPCPRKTGTIGGGGNDNDNDNDNFEKGNEEEAGACLDLDLNLNISGGDYCNTIGEDFGLGESVDRNLYFKTREK